MEFLTQLFDLLTSPPGSLVYFMVLVFCTVSAFWWSYAQWRSTEFPQAKRTVIGLGILFTAQVIMLVFGGLAWQGLVDPNIILPVLDRAVVFFSVVWIIWLWAFPEPAGKADTAAILLSVVDAIAVVVSVAFRSQQYAGVPFNDTVQSAAWAVAILGLSGFGIGIIFYRRPNNFENGLAMLLLIFTGFALDLFFPTSGGNYSGFGRLMLMAAFPILLTLPQRFPSPTQALPRQPAIRAMTDEGTGEEPPTNGEGKPLRERRRYSTDAKTLHALLDLAAENDPNKINDDITRAVAQSMLADLSFLIYLADNKQMVISSGYDLIREEKLEGTQLNKDMVPLLANAVQRGRPLRLPASSTSSDLKGLGDLLGLSTPGHLLNVPVANDKGPIGSILLLSPYSNRMWNADDQTFLANIATSFVSIVERGQFIARLEHERDNVKPDHGQSQSVVDNLEAQLAELRTENEKHQESSEHLIALMAIHEEAQHRISALEKEANETQQLLAALEKENEGLRTGQGIIENTPSGPESAQLENELRLTLGEVARLQNTLADANLKVLELEKRSSGSMTSDQAEVIASISQELRQPMSSIIGYTDLLLGESVGILGALQRKFIERIKASTERIGSLIEDLIQITTIGIGLMALKPEAIDLNLIIDNAMAYTSSQLRERNITLRIDLPKSTEHIYADREALQQILIHLLQNAGAASPVEGTVTLRVRTEKQDDNDFVLIQVADTGGGIPTEDLPRVFSRLYRADNVLIQGVGDTGVGLSIAKTLTEAQGGRIWVDSEIGVGATFSVLLPVSQAEPEARAEKEQKGE